jgi:hypothetical protein
LALDTLGHITMMLPSRVLLSMLSSESNACRLPAQFLLFACRLWSKRKPAAHVLLGAILKSCPLLTLLVGWGIRVAGSTFVQVFYRCQRLMSLPSAESGITGEEKDRKRGQNAVVVLILDRTRRTRPAGERDDLLRARPGKSQRQSQIRAVSIMGRRCR